MVWPITPHTSRTQSYCLIAFYLSPWGGTVEILVKPEFTCPGTVMRLANPKTINRLGLRFHRPLIVGIGSTGFLSSISSRPQDSIRTHSNTLGLLVDTGISSSSYSALVLLLIFCCSSHAVLSLSCLFFLFIYFPFLFSESSFSFLCWWSNHWISCFLCSVSLFVRSLLALAHILISQSSPHPDTSFHLH
jgi:hypothetical protein